MRWCLYPTKTHDLHYNMCLGGPLNVERSVLQGPQLGGRGIIAKPASKATENCRCRALSIANSDTVDGKRSLVIFFMSAADICCPRAVHYRRQPRSTEPLGNYFAKHGDGAHVIHCSLVLEVFDGLQNRTDPTHFTNIYHHRLIEQCNSSATVQDSLGN